MACSTEAARAIKKALAEAGADPFEIAALAIERVERLEAQLQQLSAVPQNGSGHIKRKLVPRNRRPVSAFASPPERLRP
jgi:hypothetical protein